MNASTGRTPGSPAAKAHRLLHLEAARGIAAIIVVLFHFLQFHSQPLIGSINPNDIIVVNGIFAVSFFFVLSSYALSHGKIGTVNTRVLAEAVFKRYPRLAIPALASTILAVLLAHLPMGSIPEIVKRDGASISVDFYVAAEDPLSAIPQGLVMPFASATSALNPPLWSMHVEFIGSLALFALCWLATRLGSWRWIIYATSIPLIYQFSSPYFLAFPLGALLNERSLAADRISGWPRAIVFTITLALAALLSAYPSDGTASPLPPGSPLGLAWKFLPTVRDPFTFWRVIGAWMALWVLVNSSFCVRSFSGPISVWLGRLSFPIYLVHWPILNTVGMYAIEHLADIAPARAATITFAVVAVMTLCASIPFYYFVDRLAVSYTTKCFRWRTAPI